MKINLFFSTSLKTALEVTDYKRFKFSQCRIAGIIKGCNVTLFIFFIVSVIVSDLTLSPFLLQYSGNKAKVDFNFGDYSTKAQVLAAVDRIKYLRENTNTTGGLKVARLDVFGGNYVQRPNAERLIVLITDGVPTYDADKLDDEVAAIKRMNIRIVGLGVTQKVVIDDFFYFIY